MNRLLILLSVLSVLAAAPGAPAADDKQDPPPFKLSDDEKTLLDLTNAERAKEKLPPLTANPLLFRAARAHSANMAKKGEMKHVLDGKDPQDRLDAVHYDLRKCGENIAYSDGVSLQEIMKKWMDSKVHRDNILDPAFAEIGIGVARNDKGEIYYTQDFGVAFEKP
jgi:uncharacterized protein YkwD